MIPVTGQLVKVALGHIWGFCQKPATSLLLVLHKALESLDYARSVGKKNGQTLTDDVGGRKYLQLTSELVVVTLFGLLKHSQISVKVVFLRESRSVYSLEHLVV